jgi:hypothetical protein
MAVQETPEGAQTRKCDENRNCESNNGLFEFVRVDFRDHGSPDGNGTPPLRQPELTLFAYSSWHGFVGVQYYNIQAK